MRFFKRPFFDLKRLREDGESDERKALPKRVLGRFDNKDVFAFILAIFELFAPLFLGLLIVGILITIIVYHIF